MSVRPHDVPIVGAQETVLAGERVLLLPERALLWPAQDTLLIADTHWGKAATFRAAAIPVPGESVHDDLTRLDGALSRSGATRLVVLGDLLHARAGRDPAMLAEVAEWRARHLDLAWWLVRGNHDRGAGDPPAVWGVRVLDEPASFGPFALAHHPTPSEGAYTLAGHLHPAVLLAGSGRQRLRLPCFWLGARLAVLPAFGAFTGAAGIAPAADDRVFAVVEDGIVEISHHGR